MTGINSTQNLNNPAFNLADGEAIPGPFSLANDGRQIGRQKLEYENSVFVFAPKVLVHIDDIRGVLKDLKSINLSECRLVVVDLLEGDDG
jgi:hypothetical protein